MSRVVLRFFIHLYLTIGMRKSTLSNMDTETQPTKSGPCEVYYDDSTSRYYIASGAAWASLQSGKYESYSMWCSTCADSDSVTLMGTMTRMMPSLLQRDWMQPAQALPSPALSGRAPMPAMRWQGCTSPVFRAGAYSIRARHHGQRPVPRGLCGLRSSWHWLQEMASPRWLLKVRGA